MHYTNNFENKYGVTFFKPIKFLGLCLSTASSESGLCSNPNRNVAAYLFSNFKFNVCLPCQWQNNNNNNNNISGKTSISSTSAPGGSWWPGRCWASWATPSGRGWPWSSGRSGPRWSPSYCHLFCAVLPLSSSESSLNPYYLSLAKLLNLRRNQG